MCAMSVSYDAKDADHTPLSPTEEASRDFYAAFLHLNEALFGGKLRDCLITMQRRSNTRGYFANERFGHRQSASVLDEIALNPATFKGRTDRETISTLVHEMTHLWQQQFGKPGRGRYHNAQWGDKMEELGLVPSSTGEPGGKRTGQRVSHYIIDGGPFDVCWKRLADEGFALDWQDRADEQPAGKVKDKVKYRCVQCGLQVWGKPDLRIRCEDCGELLCS
jgi:predicted SprT family Zn-dependent metalloprotease